MYIPPSPSHYFPLSQRSDFIFHPEGSESFPEELREITQNYSGLSSFEPPFDPVADKNEPKRIEELDAVPEELHDDPFFQEHLDPISYEPIFDPVADKNEPKHIYEREVIVRWLKDHSTSPLTRKPMTIADLVLVPELKKKINEKISDYLLQKHAELERKNEEKEKEKKASKQCQEALSDNLRLGHDLSELDHLSALDHQIVLAMKRQIDQLENSGDELKRLLGTIVESVDSPSNSLVQSIFVELFPKPYI